MCSFKIAQGHMPSNRVDGEVEKIKRSGGEVSNNTLILYKSQFITKLTIIITFKLPLCGQAYFNSVLGSKMPVINKIIQLYSLSKQYQSPCYNCQTFPIKLLIKFISAQFFHTKSPAMHISFFISTGCFQRNLLRPTNFYFVRRRIISVLLL